MLFLFRRFSSRFPLPLTILSPAIQTTIQKPVQKSVIFKESELVEKFIKGGGNGGQKINKTCNCVDLLHVPSGIRIKCQKTRSLQQNRAEARKLLAQQLDLELNGPLSKIEQRRDLIRERKRRRALKAKKKYGNPQG